MNYYHLIWIIPLILLIPTILITATIVAFRRMKKGSGSTKTGKSATSSGHGHDDHGHSEKTHWIWYILNYGGWLLIIIVVFLVVYYWLWPLGVALYNGYNSGSGQQQTTKQIVRQFTNRTFAVPKECISMPLEKGPYFYSKGGGIEITTPSGKVFTDLPGVDRKQEYEDPGTYKFCPAEKNSGHSIEIYNWW